MGEYTTISITHKNKDELDKRKLHRREPYNEVLTRILKKSGEKQGDKTKEEG